MLVLQLSVVGSEDADIELNTSDDDAETDGFEIYGFEASGSGIVYDAFAFHENDEIVLCEDDELFDSDPLLVKNPIQSMYSERSSKSPLKNGSE